MQFTLLLLGLLLLPLNASAQDLAFDRSPTAVVVTYLERLDGLADADPGPSITVFGDGRVLIHTPRYMKGAGDREVRLSRSELDQLVRDLANDGILDMTQADLNPSEEAGGGGQASSASAPEYVSHPSTTEITLRAQTSGARRTTSRRLQVHALDRRLRSEPSSQPLRSFARAEERLRALRQIPSP